MLSNQCAACGAAENLQAHHLIPRSLGGSDEETNLITLCAACHAKAHNLKSSGWSNELTRKALQAKKSRGERVGHIPFGKRLAADGIHLEDDQTEQAVIETARVMRQEGMSLRKIAAELNGQGFNARKRDRSPWNHVNLHTILKRSQTM